MKWHQCPHSSNAAAEEWARRQLLHQWIDLALQRYGFAAQNLQLITGEASHRRYYRVWSAKRRKAFVIMDAVPSLEDNVAFVTIANLLASARVRVPAIYEWDKANGFLLLEDVGTETLLHLNLRARSETVRPYYFQAVDTLIDMQLNAQASELATFSSETMRAELDLFTDWYLARHLKTKLTSKQQRELSSFFDLIAERNHMPKQVFVHRDFRPGNLAISEDGNTMAVLDFQDATKGPLTYDLVSLLWDAFHCWDTQFTQQIVSYYWVTAIRKGLPVPSTLTAFDTSLYWTRLQRHVRVIGIFTRLALRDGKKKYLGEIARFNKYIISSTTTKDSARPLLQLLDSINTY
ncbi:aminoglycoside phosphotransferase family protein [Pseudomonas soli]|uniref:Phosphotransferase n=1 Tax=Pseudomonas soli TaxID=1306993 RepID=A0AAJ5MJA1_9PSED|nr:phosphotransferase [Pseudomonas soli]UXZ43984.1 phosphotransferase [Pseudomonas soli]